MVCGNAYTCLMSYFSTTLSEVLQRSYSGKQTALASSSGLEQSEISRLLRESSPCTAAKLAKLCDAPDMPEDDQRALCVAAIHDLLPPRLWQLLFEGEKSMAEQLQESAGFHYVGTHKLPAYPDQVLRYLLDNAQRDADVAGALELIGKFLEIKGKG
jgi:hypothetical protein